MCKIRSSPHFFFNLSGYYCIICTSANKPHKIFIICQTIAHTVYPDLARFRADNFSLKIQDFWIKWMMTYKICPSTEPNVTSLQPQASITFRRNFTFSRIRSQCHSDSFFFCPITAVWNRMGFRNTRSIAAESCWWAGVLTRWENQTYKMLWISLSPTSHCHKGVSHGYARLRSYESVSVCTQTCREARRDSSPPAWRCSLWEVLSVFQLDFECPKWEIFLLFCQRRVLQCNNHTVRQTPLENLSGVSLS